MRRSVGLTLRTTTIDFVAYVDKLRRMLHALRPSHFADVDEAFDALLEFDERSVIG